MAKRLLLCVVSILLAAGSASAGSISILEPADKTQPIQFSYSGFLPGATSTVGTESVTFSGMIDSGFFVGGYTFDVWMLESGGLKDLGLGFVSADVSDEVRVEFGVVLNNVAFPGACPPNVQSCQTITGNDVAYGLQLPVPVASLVIHTVGSVASNTVLSMWTSDCATELACDDDGAPTTSDNKSMITRTNVPAGNYAIQVDSFSTTNNAAFLLNVRGTVAPGTACTSPLFATGVLACPSGTACSGGTCQ